MPFVLLLEDLLNSLNMAYYNIPVL